MHQAGYCDQWQNEVKRNIIRTKENNRRQLSGKNYPNHRQVFQIYFRGCKLLMLRKENGPLISNNSVGTDSVSGIGTSVKQGCCFFVLLAPTPFLSQYIDRSWLCSQNEGSDFSSHKNRNIIETKTQRCILSDRRNSSNQ